MIWKSFKEGIYFEAIYIYIFKSIFIYFEVLYIYIYIYILEIVHIFLNFLLE